VSSGYVRLNKFMQCKVKLLQFIPRQARLGQFGLGRFFSLGVVWSGSVLLCQGISR